MPNNKKLKPLAEMALISEIVNQSKIAERAADQLTKASEQIEYWGSIQSILIAASNVSKILWPARSKYKARGKQLRELLSVDGANLLTDRTIRNHFEHYDERIEDWFDSKKTSVYKDLEINPFEPSPWSLPRFSHRSYNPISQTLFFRNEVINLAEVVAALVEVREKCRPFVLTLEHHAV